ncbi:hypothetical protein [Micromonospora rubida]
MSGSVTITASGLAQALGATVPFTSRDVTLPAICAVELRAADGVLTATATDRYVIGHARQAATGALSMPRYLHRRDAKSLRNQLLAHMEHRETGTDPVTITEHDDRLTFAFEPITMSFVQPEGVDNFPDLGAILAAMPARDAEGLHTPVGLSHRVLHPLTKACTWDKFSPPRWTFDGPRKPVRVEIGDWFIAALMPVSLSGDEQPVSVDMPAPAEAGAR